MAARLTGWDIDILTPKEYNEGIERLANCVKSIEGADDTVKTSVEDYAVLIKQNIFGVTDISNMEKKSPEDEFDDVVTLVGEELNLQLIGTVSGNSAVSRAIIKNNKNNQLGMYKTGQNIAGARIKSIKENAVFLLHKGQSQGKLKSGRLVFLSNWVYLPQDDRALIHLRL